MPFRAALVALFALPLIASSSPANAIPLTIHQCNALYEAINAKSKGPYDASWKKPNQSLKDIERANAWRDGLVSLQVRLKLACERNDFAAAQERADEIVAHLTRAPR